MLYSQLQIKKWGNSAAIRLPNAILQSLSINVDDNLKLEIRQGALILTPEKTTGIDQLFAGYHENEYPNEIIDKGDPQGNELA